MEETFKNISASQFKAKCLAILDEVASTKIPLIVTKRGKPIAKLIPLESLESPDLLGSVTYKTEQDMLCSVDEKWEADQ